MAKIHKLFTDDICTQSICWGLHEFNCGSQSIFNLWDSRINQRNSDTLSWRQALGFWCLSCLDKKRSISLHLAVPRIATVVAGSRRKSIHATAIQIKMLSKHDDSGGNCVDWEGVPKGVQLMLSAFYSDSVIFFIVFHLISRCNPRVRNICCSKSQMP